ncbi:hypothetical protein CGJ06_14350 [Vibrio parahaemolyticus]|nr:hypothetical protein CGJ06_14350 [Vibrio parahaemolyticus]
MSSDANGVPIATLKTIRYKKGVVGTNLLRLSKFGALPDLNWGPIDYESYQVHFYEYAMLGNFY